MTAAILRGAWLCLAVLGFSVVMQAKGAESAAPGYRFQRGGWTTSIWKARPRRLGTSMGGYWRRRSRTWRRF